MKRTSNQITLVEQLQNQWSKSEAKLGLSANSKL